MSYSRQKLVKALSELGNTMVLFGENAPYGKFHGLLDETFYDKFNQAIKKEKIYNGWFTEDAVRKSLLEQGTWLSETNLNEWLSNYSWSEKPKSVGVIMAGNIPLVGFHDFLAVLCSGHKAKIKLSSDDSRLFPFLLEVLMLFLPDVEAYVSIAPHLKQIDAVIATGSDNSARYFEKYFGQIPNIIRKNRTSVAVIDGSEKEEELHALGKDVFTYFGLGCRNVSKLLLPEDFDMNRFFKAVLPFAEIVHHNKYANNYDYHKAIYLMNQETVIENGFLLTKETTELFAPIAVLYLQRFESKDKVKQYLQENEDKIQAVIGHDYLPFGSAQCPTLTDYADGVDTMQFLEQL